MILMEPNTCPTHSWLNQLSKQYKALLYDSEALLLPGINKKENEK